MADWLEEIENRKKRRETDRVFFGCYDLQRDADEEKLIAEVKRLQNAASEEHERFLLALQDCQEKDFRIGELEDTLEKLRIENAKIKAEHRLMKISIAQRNIQTQRLK